MIQTWFQKENEIKLGWRCLEGFTTGLMLIVYFYKQQMNLIRWVVFLTHWFFSIRFHLTYEQKEKSKDQIWIQFVSIERLDLFFPFGGSIMRYFILPFLTFYMKNIPQRTKMISTLSVIFYLYYVREKGFLFLFWILVSVAFFQLNHPTWVNRWFQTKLTLEERSPLLCIAFHYTVCLSALYDQSEKFSDHLFYNSLLRVQILNLIFYGIIFFVSI